LNNSEASAQGKNTEDEELYSSISATLSSIYEAKHESAILAGALTLEAYLNQLRSVLIEGKAPETAGIAGRPMPLPPKEAEKAKEDLDELGKDIAKLKRRFAYALDQSPSLALSYMWSSVLLGKMEGTINSLKPSNLEKSKGPMSTEYRKYLEEVLPRIEKKVVELRKKYTTSKEASNKKKEAVGMGL